MSSFVRVGGALALCLGSFSTLAGPLTPPGAPAPTMKTLHEVEPRIAINATNTPGNAANLFLINQSGSYYLTEDIFVNSFINGIFIDAPDVTVDLMGFTVEGTPVSASGIVATDPTSTNIVVRNGTVTGWGTDGIRLLTSNNRVEDVRVFNNSARGIDLNDGGTILRSTSIGNGDRGIDIGSDSSVQECTSTDNGGYGIYTGNHSRVMECSALRNGLGAGIRTGFGSMIRDCISNENTGHGFSTSNTNIVTECTARSNTSDGFVIGQASTVSNCASEFNSSGDGYDLSTNTNISNSTSYSNSIGFRTAANTILEGCNARANAVDGFFTGNGCTLIGCSARANGAEGFDVGLAGTLESCSAYDNTTNGFNLDDACAITNSAAFQNDGIGILAGDGVLISDCTVRNSGGHGISIATDGTVKGCTVSNSGLDGAITDGAGVFTVGDHNMIEANHFIENDVAVNANSQFCLIIGNRLKKEAVDNEMWNTANAAVGERINVNSVLDFITTNPHANIEY